MDLSKACTQLLQTYLPKSPAPHLPSLPVPWEPERRVTLCCLSYILLGICSQPWQKLCSPWSRVENHLLGSLLLLVHSLLWHHKKLLWEVIEISSYKALQPTAVCLDAAEKLLLDREHLDFYTWPDKLESPNLLDLDIGRFPLCWLDFVFSCSFRYVHSMLFVEAQISAYVFILFNCSI